MEARALWWQTLALLHITKVWSKCWDFKPINLVAISVCVYQNCCKFRTKTNYKLSLKVLIKTWPVWILIKLTKFSKSNLKVKYPCKFWNVWYWKLKITFRSFKWGITHFCTLAMNRAGACFPNCVWKKSSFLTAS